MAETTKAGSLEAPVLPVYFMQLLTDQVDARLGKMKTGQVVPMDEDMAQRFLISGIAKQVPAGTYEDQQQKRQQRLSARQDAFAKLNQAWRAGNQQDVLTASDEGLKAAWDAGLPLSNVEQLKDEDGLPLLANADIEEILDARERLHPDAQFPYSASERSSVMGGGSHFTPTGGRSLPAPGTTTPGRAGRQARRAEVLHGRQGSGESTPPPPPPAPTPPPTS